MSDEESECIRTFGKKKTLGFNDELDAPEIHRKIRGKNDAWRRRVQGSAPRQPAEKAQDSNTKARYDKKISTIVCQENEQYRRLDENGPFADTPT